MGVNAERIQRDPHLTVLIRVNFLDGSSKAFKIRHDMQWGEGIPSETAEYDNLMSSHLLA